MYDDIFSYLGDDIENLAMQAHFCIRNAAYVIVAEDGSYKTISPERMQFNSRLRGHDLLSGLISINKPLAKKSVYSNNYGAFWFKKVLPREDVTAYFAAAELPEDKRWFESWILDHQEELVSAYGGNPKNYIKIFFPVSREEIYNASMRYLREKCISQNPEIRKIDPDKGVPYGYNLNAKKGGTPSRSLYYLVDREKGLKIWFLYTFLRSLSLQNKRLLWIFDGGFYAGDVTDTPPFKIPGGVFLHITRTPHGEIIIDDFSVFSGYNPMLGGKR